MYCYIYDKIALERRNERLISEIEKRITDLGLQGEIERVTPIRGLSQCIELSAGRKCSTLVMVGDDSTFSKAISHSVEMQVPIGFIPVKEGVLSKVLGIPKGVAACEVLSRRKIKRLDLGKIEDNYFVTTAEISAEGKNPFRKESADRTVKVNIDSQFDLSTSILGLRIANLDPASPENFSIADGMLNLIMIPSDSKKDRSFKKGEWSEMKERTVASFKRASIFGSRSLRLTVDGRGVGKLPVNVSVAPGKLEAIVGVQRLVG